MAKKEIEEILLNQPGFYGIVIKEYSYKVFIEKAESATLDLPFETEDYVYFVYYHFYKRDLKTHYFKHLKDAEDYALRLSKELNICKKRGRKQNPRKHNFHLNSDDKYLDFITFDDNEKIKYTITKKNRPACFQGYDYANRTILFSKLFNSYEAAMDYALFTVYPYCIRYRAKDIEKRKYGIVYKEYTDYNLFISYTGELFFVNILNEEKKIVMSFAYTNMFDAEEKAEKEIKEIKRRG